MKKIVLILLVDLVIACSSVPENQTNSALQLHYQTMEDLLQSNSASKQQLLALYESFLEFDEQAGVWQSSLMLSETFVEDHEKALYYARQSLKSASRMADPHMLFESSIRLYLITNDKAWLSRAKSNATTDFEKNKVHYLSGNFELIKPLNESENTEPKAYVKYWRAKHKKDLMLASQAYALFKISANSTGVADTLFLMAKLHLENGNINAASDHAERAYLVFVSRGNVDVASTIKSWADDHELTW